VTQYRYAATDLITGAVLADQIPLNVQQFSAQLNGGGSLTGSLNLSQVYSQNAPFIRALECSRAVLWALADNYPVWNGVVWDWPDTTRADGTLPIAAQTMDSVWGKRLITASLEYDDVDLFGVFIDLVQYGTTKTSKYITSTSPFTGPASPLIAQAAMVAGLVLPSGAAAVSGQSWSGSYSYSDLGQVASAFTDLVSVGLEYAFVPQLTSSGGLVTGLYLAYDTGLGRPTPENGYSVVYPGNASDYGYQRTGSQGANFLWATGAPNGSLAPWESKYPHGVDLAMLEAGYPLMEDTVSWQGSSLTEQSQIDSYADGQMALRTQAMTMPVIKIPDGVIPGIGDLTLGDVIPFAATSPLHPPGPGGAPGLQANVRLTGWTCYPPGPDQSGYVQLATSQILTVPS
jgi:hypothetical protein